MAEDGPCGKICNGVVGMLCGIALLPLSLFLLGWNESHYVCEQKKILYADSKAMEIGCDNRDVKGKTFAFFSCPFVTSTLQKFDQCSWGGVAEEHTLQWREDASLARSLSASSTAASGCTSLPKVNFTSVSGRRLVEVNQCKESCSGARDAEKTDCSYSVEWTSTPIIAASFSDKSLARMQCQGFNGTNPLPPSWLSLGDETQFVSDPVVGATNQSEASGGWKLNAGLVQQLDAKDIVAYHSFEPTKFSPSSVCGSLGCVRIKYYKSASTMPSVFATVRVDGRTEQQLMPGSWGCKASMWQAIFADQMDKSEAIADLHAANTTLAWVLRILGLVLAIASIFLCLQPIAAAASVVGDCFTFIPCFGFAKDMIEGLTCIILCPISTAVGCACGLFVIFFMWLFMRPLLAFGGFILVGLLCTAAATLYRVAKKPSQLGADSPDLEMPANGRNPGVPSPAMRPVSAQPVAVAQAVPVAVAPPPSTMMVSCPAGCGPGSMLQIQTPVGGQMQVAVPDGVQPGMQFEVRY